MKRKTVIAVSTSILIVAAAGSAVWFSQKEWPLFNKAERVLQVQDRVTVFHQLGAIAMDRNQIGQLSIHSTMKGKAVEFLFDVTDIEHKPLLLRSNNHSSVLTQIPHSKETIMEYDGDLYIVNVETKTINAVLNNNYKSYSYAEISNSLTEKNIDHTSLVWGSLASISPDGKRMAFFSNRNIAFEENLNGQLWIKDFATGEENPVTDWRFHVLGWETDNSIIVQAAEKIGRLHVKAGNIEWIEHFSLVNGYNFPYLIMQQSEKEIMVMNLETGNTRTYTSESFNQVSQITMMEGSPWVIMLNAPDRTKLDRNLVVLNVGTGENTEIEPPDDADFQHIQWADKGRFMVNLRQVASTKEETYIMELDRVIE